MIIIVGIDYSITSPAICLQRYGPDTFDRNLFISCSSFCYSSSNTHFERDGQEKIKLDNIEVMRYPIDWKSQEERHDILSNWVLDCIKTEYPIHQYFVVLEDYAYSRHNGRMLSMAENVGLLKHKLWKDNYSFVCVSPSKLKKFASGKGNANKEYMYEAFLSQGNSDIKKQFGTKGNKIGSPVSDIVDSYYLCKMGEELYKVRHILDVRKS